MIIESYNDLVKIIEQRRRELRIPVHTIADHLGIARANASRGINGVSQLRFEHIVKLLNFLGYEFVIQKQGLTLIESDISEFQKRLSDKETRIKYLEILLHTAQSVLKESDLDKDKYPLLKQLMNEKLDF